MAGTLTMDRTWPLSSLFGVPEERGDRHTYQTTWISVNKNRTAAVQTSPPDAHSTSIAFEWPHRGISGLPAGQHFARHVKDNPSPTTPESGEVVSPLVPDPMVHLCTAVSVASEAIGWYPSQLKEGILSKEATLRMRMS